jgi:hypothetical protein
MAMHAALIKIARYGALRLDVDPPHVRREPKCRQIHVERLDAPCSTAA